jgi:rSAM/selenodomain-associated transferase 2
VTVSIIIPTLNEEGYIALAIRSARAQNPGEIIVVDGGSTDGTESEARDADRFLVAPRGRARQMNTAARHAVGDLLVFLHADCELEAGAVDAAEALLSRRGIAGGCFQHTVPSKAWLYRSIDWCASARVRLTGLAYGDQGLFLRRELFHRLGGFPELRLMEDLFFCRKLRREGRVAVAPKRIFVSPRRWRHVGIIRQSMRNWSLTALAALGISPDQLARFYPAVR